MKKKTKAAPKKSKSIKSPKIAETDLPALPVVQPPKAVMTEAKIIEGLDLLGITSKLDERQKRLFVEVCRLHNLNPLEKEIHAVSMYDRDAKEAKLVPVTGYEVYIDRAEASGRLEYWFPEETGEIPGPGGVKITVKRKDWSKPFSYTVYYKECVRFNREGKPNAIWSEKPRFMTMKCAVATVFRLVFRDILRKMPYIPEEIAWTEEEIAEKEAEDLKEPQEVKTPPPEIELVEEKKEEPPKDIELKVARDELNKVYKKIMSGNANLKKPFEPTEIAAFLKASQEAKESPEKLRELAIEWMSSLDERS